MDKWLINSKRKLTDNSNTPSSSNSKPHSQEDSEKLKQKKNTTSIWRMDLLGVERKMSPNHTVLCVMKPFRTAR